MAFFIPNQENTQAQTANERKYYTGLVNLKLMPYVNPTNEQLEEMGFYTRDEEPDYTYAKGDRITVGLEHNSPVYDLKGNRVYVDAIPTDITLYDNTGEETTLAKATGEVFDQKGNQLGLLKEKKKENFFLSHTAAWPKEKSGEFFTFILCDDAIVRWVKVEKKGKDWIPVLTDDKTKHIKDYKMFFSYGQVLAFNFFYSCSGWESINIGIMMDNKKIRENWTKQKAKRETLTKLKDFKVEGINPETNETETMSTSPFQIYDMLFPKVDYVQLQEFVKAISEQHGGITGLLGVSFRDGKVYPSLFAEYSSIGRAARPDYTPKFANNLATRIDKNPPQEEFYNTSKMYLMEWKGDMQPTSNVDEMDLNGGAQDFVDDFSDLDI